MGYDGRERRRENERERERTKDVRACLRARKRNRVFLQFNFTGASTREAFTSAGGTDLLLPPRRRVQLPRDPCVRNLSEVSESYPQPGRSPSRISAKYYPRRRQASSFLPLSPAFLSCRKQGETSAPRLSISFPFYSVGERKPRR